MKIKATKHKYKRNAKRKTYLKNGSTPIKLFHICAYNKGNQIWFLYKAEKREREREKFKSNKYLSLVKTTTSASFKITVRMSVLQFSFFP